MSLKPRKVDFSEILEKIKQTAERVVTLKPLPRIDWNRRFSDIYELCVAIPEPQAEKLYFELKQLIDRHIKNLLEDLLSRGSEHLLSNYHAQWKVFSKGVDYLNSLCCYLNYQYVRKSKQNDIEHFYGTFSFESHEEYEIGELALELWKKNMIKPLETSLVSAILDRIYQHRKGKLDETQVDIVKGTVESFIAVNEHKRRGALEVYQKLAEGPIVIASGEFYRNQAQEWLQTCSVSEYMKKVLVLFHEEDNRARLLLHKSSVPVLRKCCEKYMVVDNVELLYAECDNIVSGERRDDMAHMYQLLRSVSNGVQKFAHTFRTEITAVGLIDVAAIKGENSHILFVEMMITLYTKYRKLIDEIFCNDQNFINALDKTCREVANFNPPDKSSASEYLARYCDHLLKKSKGLTDSEVEEKLNNSITVFRYIDDKDVFQRIYSRMLAKRLIYQHSQSMDAEEGMINRLKQACGYEFTSKLHRMFTDISISDDFSEKFVTDYLEPNGINFKFNTTFYILQAGAWPLSPTCPSLLLPKELVAVLRAFEQFYYSRFSGRKLTWLHSLSQVDLKLSFTDKPYIVTMQAYHMATMLLFENTNSLTVSEIENAVQIEKDFLFKVIQALIESKLFVSNTEALNDDSVISINCDFTNKRTRVRITNVNLKDSAQEIPHTVSCVEDDRKLYLQATIVRLMKSRKLLKHSQLVQEIIEHCPSFSPSMSIIKKCIETLIEKQYIERTPDNPDEYSYVA